MIKKTLKIDYCQIHYQVYTIKSHRPHDSQGVQPGSDEVIMARWYHIPYYFYIMSLYGPDMSRLPRPISKLSCCVFPLLKTVKHAECCLLHKTPRYWTWVSCGCVLLLQQHYSQPVTHYRHYILSRVTSTKVINCCVTIKRYSINNIIIGLYLMLTVTEMGSWSILRNFTLARLSDQIPKHTHPNIIICKHPTRLITAYI